MKAAKHLVKNLNESTPPLAHFYDRFCVHKQHCRHRGLYPNANCLNVKQLDTVVRNTFYEKLRRERLDPNRLVYTQFCCCDFKDLCNDMSSQSIAELFNISTRSLIKHRERKTPTKFDNNFSMNTKTFGYILFFFLYIYKIL